MIKRTVSLSSGLNLNHALNLSSHDKFKPCIQFFISANTVDHTYIITNSSFICFPCMQKILRVANSITPTSFMVFCIGQFNIKFLTIKGENNNINYLVWERDKELLKKWSEAQYLIHTIISIILITCKVGRFKPHYIDFRLQ